MSQPDASAEDLHPQAPLLQSKAFLAAYEACSAPGSNKTAVPAVVCLAFAAELGLKSLLLSERNRKAGHELKPLFDALGAVTQDEIISYTHTQTESFHEYLEHVSDAFIKWRYIYETKGRQSVSVEFLLVFVRAVHRAADARKGLIG